jgi:hypothetical protein
MAPSPKWALSFFLLSKEINLVYSDIYMHNPRGSNDRNCERNVNRNNGNRLFDSQNNAKGGYACPRAVGDESVQNEDGIAKTAQFKQDKKMYFYEGSYLPIEWTNQHGCGRNSKTNCEIVIQYMCEDTADPLVDNFWPYTSTKNCDGTSNKNCGAQAFRDDTHIAAPRDGIPTDADDAATDTIPDTEDAAIPDTAADRRFGMHESYGFYDLCQHTSRNKGLYTADQRVRRNDQRGTRQNPNGDRRGLECPEERDYYPWWHPSPWVDVAILTNDAQNKSCTDPWDEDCSARCKYYQENTFNKNYKGYCDVKHDGTQAVTAKTNSNAWNNRLWYNNNESCTAAGFTWFEISLSDVLNLTYPVCERTGFSRVNQLGNAADRTVAAYPDELGAPDGLNANRYMWTIPKIPNIVTADTYFEGVNGDGMEDAYASCVVRIRYNLSTSDFPAWPADAMESTHPWRHKMVDAGNNSLTVNDYKNTPLTQDPYVYIGTGDADADDDGDDRTGYGDEKFVSLAVNTNQYARTFQDRSYKFAIKPRPTVHAAKNDQTDTPRILAVSDDAKIFNVNVRGKRGNIVQTYPAVEYDFVPNSLALSPGDVVHFQWTGSDYNPRRGCNDAEGGPPDPNDFVSSSQFNSRADRSNIVFLNSMAENAPMDYISYTAYTDDDKIDPLKGEYDFKVANMIENLYNNTPCPVNHGDCFEQVMRLAYLNQQSDLGSLGLRRGQPCLTQEELDAILNEEERNNHPLNCAKMNAKPYPYFDGGVMKVSVPGKFAFFSSRNNNFSNRDQTGVICVKGMKSDGTMENCYLDGATGVLQDTNMALSTSLQQRMTRKDAAAAACIDSANSNGKGTANDQGATSCLTSTSGSSSDILSASTFTTEQAANDAMGSGDKRSCIQISWFFNGDGSVVSYLGLAVGLAFAGFAAAWASVYCYNRIKARREAEKETKFQGTKHWKRALDDREVI